MDCAICFEPLQENKNLLVTDCSHRFHYSCFKLWEHETCPMCRQNVVDHNPATNILENLSTLLQTDSADPKQMVLYLHHLSQGITQHVPALYRSLILHNTRLLIDTMDDPLGYIIKHRLYDLLPNYPYSNYENDLVKLDDMRTIPYIQMNENTLYSIVKQGSINLLTHYQHHIRTEQMYTEEHYIKILHKLTLMGIACLHGHNTLLPILLQHFDINHVNEWNCTVLYAAIATGRFSTVRWLVDHGIDVNITHNCGNSPLFYAIETLQTRIAHYLINRGATIEYRLVHSCLRFPSHNLSGVKILQRILRLLPHDATQDKSHVNLCERSPHAHNDKATPCWCPDCNLKNHNCGVIRPPFLHEACFFKRFHCILLLLVHDPNLIYGTNQICTHMDKHIEHHQKTNDEDIIQYLSSIASTANAEELVHMHLKFKSFKPVCDYIVKLIKRGPPYSYKHQRKILSKLYADATKHMFLAAPPSGQGLYHSFLYR